MSYSQPRKRPRRQASCHALNGTKYNDSSNKGWMEMEQEAVFRLLQSGRGIIFSGAGMSVAAGLNIFSSTVAQDKLPKSKSWRHKKKKLQQDEQEQPQKKQSLSSSTSTSLGRKFGLYDQAAKKLGLKDGMEAFRFRFFNKFPRQCFHLLECLYWQVAAASPTLAHQIVHHMGNDRVIIRHYTLNIDGLATKSTSTTSTHHDKEETTTQPATNVVELHGSLHQLVCRTCKAVYPTSTILTNPSRYQPLSDDSLQSNATTENIYPPVPSCPTQDCNGELRFRILLYEDLEGHLIHGGNHDDSPLESLLPGDLAMAQWILWVGVSFRQQASCEYFAKVLQHSRVAAPTTTTCPVVVIVDPRVHDVLEDLETVVGTLDGSVDCYPMAMTSDEFFQKVESFSN